MSLRGAALKFLHKLFFCTWKLINNERVNDRRAIKIYDRIVVVEY